ncbi:hypothetical protein O7635_29590 [Asanoa sp. WMMD1127]|uniref:hypothetical protein n=1 Tax=Asanoa sp. WMMD1127 TaxID=3016107 RepID=UPI002417F59C|nr:hypothetical protein [Asanoa sp. WMMD1127]MDG4826023.1 hypothetical protein [Asanoa sp. WMMD1127]
MRFLSGRAVTLTHTFLDDEDALTPDDVTVTVTRDGASTPTAEGPATRDGTVYTFSAGLLPQGVYTVRFSSSAVTDTLRIEVVGGFLFGIPEVRKPALELPATRYPAAEVRQARDVVEREFERITGRSFTPRTLYVEASDLGGCTDLLPVRDVRSVVALGTPDGPVSLTLDRVGPFAYVPELPHGTAGVEIEYGFTEVPEDIRRVGLVRLRWVLTEDRSAIPDRATSYQPVDGGTYTLATAGRAGYHTGIPDVDAVLDDYTFDVVDSVFL